MAVSLKSPQDGGIDELSEINVTPFIDVMLIFIEVCAPLRAKASLKKSGVMKSALSSSCRNATRRRLFVLNSIA
jgi:biopolymer transport protein ExbD